MVMMSLVLTPLGAQQTTLPSTPQVAAPKPGYIIGINDVVRVTVYSGGNSQPDFRQTDYTVQSDGSIALPLIKPVVVSGLTVLAAAAKIKKSLVEANQFEECTVDITMMGYHSSVLKVQGAVRNPGNIEMTAEKMNIGDALNKAGGLQPLASTEIRVKRAGGRAAEPDVLVRDGWEVYSRQDLDEGRLTDVQLYDNDTIDVPVAPKFYVQGFVLTGGEFQWEPNLTLERALIKAGGVSKEGAKNRVKVRRMNPRTKRSEEVDLGKDPMIFIIEAGDMIEVPKKRM